MSEYQYYEFLAIDKPLTPEEMADLRAISTRARITPFSFTNEYNWGDFKGNPDKLMEKYFDAHVYMSDWGNSIFMVRVPADVLSKETAQRMGLDEILHFNPSKTHWIITWSLYDSENYDRFDMEEGYGWMARLSPIRDELMCGDFRSFYIGWLAAVTMGIMEDDALEPMSVPGLGNLTSAQKALAEFLEVDQDLLAGAGMGSPSIERNELSSNDLDKWICSLPHDVVATILKQLLEGKGHQAGKTLRSRFVSWQGSLQDDRINAPRRTIAELRKNAESAEKIRLERERRQEKQEEMKRLKEREAYLKKLSKNFTKAWDTARLNIERRSGRGYEDACRNLVDLSEAYSLYVNRKTFRQELKKFMAEHLRRKALIQRMIKAGIWNKT